MQVPQTRLPELTQAVFAAERPEVYEAYSAYDRESKVFTTAEQLDQLMVGEDAVSKSSFDFAIWYPSCGGRVEKERIQLKPEKCEGHTFRFSIGGWGIFRLQFDFRRGPLIECWVTVNSYKRSLVWEAHYPEWIGVKEWNWQMVEKHKRRLTRKLRSLV